MNDGQDIEHGLESFVTQPAKDQEKPSLENSELVIGSASDSSLSQYPMTTFYQEHGNLVAKSEGVKVLLQLNAKLRETDLNDARRDRSKAEQDRDALTEKYFNERHQVGILQERLRSRDTISTFRRVLVSFGSLAAGWGMSSLFQKLPDKIAFGILAIGVILLLVGVLKGPKDKESDT